ncbi:MAG: hypothetical protein HZB38_10885 [Planctomycetes bacterium]|nr:hypothetical protein [Planctomycetota bacterium]
MQRPKVLAAFSTAAAAVIALCAFFIATPHGGTAMAMTSTILRSLRDASHRGLSVRIENINVEGVHLDGVVQILFPEPITLANLIDSTGVQPSPNVVYADLNIQGSESNEELAGLDLNACVALQQSRPWAYLRLAGLPDQVVQENPMAVLVLNFTRNGMLLDLTGLDHSDFGGQDEGASNPPGDAPRWLTSSIRVGHDRPGLTVDANIHTTMDSATEEEQPSPEDSQAQRQITEVVQDFLSGRAGAERIAEVVEQTQQVFNRVESRQTGEGEWTLRASELKPEYCTGADGEMFGRASLVIRYAQGRGILDVEIGPLGNGDGRITFGFIDSIDPALLDMQRYIDRGLQPIDVAGLTRMFGGTPEHE